MAEKEIWHSTFYQTPGSIIQILPACGFILTSLSITPLSSPGFSAHIFPFFLPSSILAFALSSLISPPVPLFCPIIYLPFLPLSIFPYPTSCFPSCQTVIINGENDSPLGPREPSTLTALRAREGESVCVWLYVCVCVHVCAYTDLCSPRTSRLGLWSTLHSMRLYVQRQR